jgi:hypothetical protein
MTDINDTADNILYEVESVRSILASYAGDIDTKLELMEGYATEIKDADENSDFKWLKDWAEENDVDCESDLSHYNDASYLWNELESYYTTDLDDIQSALTLKEEWDNSNLSGEDVEDVELEIGAYREAENRLLDFVNEGRANKSLHKLEDIDSAVEYIRDTPATSSPNIVTALQLCVESFNVLLKEMKDSGVSLNIIGTQDSHGENGAPNQATVDTDSANSDTEQPSV